MNLESKYLLQTPKTKDEAEENWLRTPKLIAKHFVFDSKIESKILTEIESFRNNFYISGFDLKTKIGWTILKRSILIYRVRKFADGHEFEIDELETEGGNHVFPIEPIFLKIKTEFYLLCFSEKHVHLFSLFAKPRIKKKIQFCKTQSLVCSSFFEDKEKELYLIFCITKSNEIFAVEIPQNLEKIKAYFYQNSFKDYDAGKILTQISKNSFSVGTIFLNIFSFGKYEFTLKVIEQYLFVRVKSLIEKKENKIHLDLVEFLNQNDETFCQENQDKVAQTKLLDFYVHPFDKYNLLIYVLYNTRVKTKRKSLILTKIRQVEYRKNIFYAGKYNQLYEIEDNQISDFQGQIKHIGDHFFILANYQSAYLRTFENIIVKIDFNLSFFETKRLFRKALGFRPFQEMSTNYQVNCIVIFSNGYQNFEGDDKKLYYCETDDKNASMIENSKLIKMETSFNAKKAVEICEFVKHLNSCFEVFLKEGIFSEYFKQELARLKMQVLLLEFLHEIKSIFYKILNENSLDYMISLKKTRKIAEISKENDSNNPSTEVLDVILLILKRKAKKLKKYYELIQLAGFVDFFTSLIPEYFGLQMTIKLSKSIRKQAIIQSTKVFVNIFLHSVFERLDSQKPEHKIKSENQDLFYFETLRVHRFFGAVNEEFRRVLIDNIPEHVSVIGSRIVHFIEAILITLSKFRKKYNAANCCVSPFYKDDQNLLSEILDFYDLFENYLTEENYNFVRALLKELAFHTQFNILNNHNLLFKLDQIFKTFQNREDPSKAFSLAKK